MQRKQIIRSILFFITALLSVSVVAAQYSPGANDKEIKIGESDTDTEEPDS